MAILFFFAFSYVLLSLSLYKVFKKAGFEPQKALIPGLNFAEWCQVIGRPKWWALLLLLPIINIFIYAGMCVDMVRSFKKYTFGDSALAVFYAPLAFYKIGKNKKDKYHGPILKKERLYAEQLLAAEQAGNKIKLKKLRARNPYYKSSARQWTEALIFAVFAAAFIRLFTVEAYAIPTSSMEGSLNVGDHLFVSKIHYGLRTPKTIIMVPLLHNRIPFFNTESYLQTPNLPFKWLPGIEKPGRNKPVVFNVPEGDSVYITPERTWSVYDYRRGNVPQNIADQIRRGQIKLTIRPIDKIDHYVKHCIGVPGDKLQIIDRQVYINGKAVKNPKNLQFRYLIKHPVPFNDQKFEEWGISQEDRQYYNSNGNAFKMLILSEEQKRKVQAMDRHIEIIPNDMYWVQFPTDYDKSQLAGLGIGNANIRANSTANRFLMTLKKGQVESLKNTDNQIIIETFDESNRLFPHDPENFAGWNTNNYGPIWVPKAGETIAVTPENIALYRRIIDIYEGNDLTIKNGRIYINGEATTQYTFKLDYYWMMGDNRNNSEDSRTWGFVPQTHILGKPLFIFFSTKENSILNGINWNRMFTSASKAG